MPQKIIAQMLVLLLLVAFLTTSMLKDTQELVIMEELNTSTVSKLFAKKEHFNFTNSILKNGVLMSKLCQDLQQTLQFILVFLIHTTESCLLTFLTEDI